MTISLQNKIIYGPVNSRRLGSSLGINVLSNQDKICNFNCVYCQYGWTKITQARLTNINSFFSVENVMTAVEKALFSLSPSPKYITLSGNGEATLHPEFDSIVDGIIKLRNKYAKNSKTAILSNSMGVTDKKIRNSLSKLDVRIMKLDCGNNFLFKLYNKPIISTDLDSIVKGLAELKEITIQSLFTAGEHGNFDDTHLEQWIEKLKVIKPIESQIYTLDRGYPSNKIYPVTLDWLHGLKQRLNDINIKSKVYI